MTLLLGTLDTVNATELVGICAFAAEHRAHKGGIQESTAVACPDFFRENQDAPRFLRPVVRNEGLARGHGSRALEERAKNTKMSAKEFIEFNRAYCDLCIDPVALSTVLPAEEESNRSNKKPEIFS